VGRDNGSREAVMAKKNDELRTVAYHEAGHAVIAFVLGRWVKRVSIVPGFYYDSQVGDVEYLGISESTDGHPYDGALVYIAGPVAQKKFGQPEPWKGTSDYFHLEEELEDFKAHDFETVKKYAETLVELMVEQHWELITALAEHLLVVKEMDRDELREFLVKTHQKMTREAHYPPEPFFDGLEACKAWAEKNKEKLTDMMTCDPQLKFKMDDK
jgi:hypothetical protein